MMNVLIATWEEVFSIRNLLFQLDRKCVELFLDFKGFMI